MSVLQRKTAPKNYLFKLTIACFEWIISLKKQFQRRHAKMQNTNFSITTVYKNWLGSVKNDKTTETELKSIENNEKEITDRFYCDLKFGTGGLRGKLGAGTNRMNVYTVGRATRGLAAYINKTASGNKSVVIAYDSRNMSRKFAG